MNYLALNQRDIDLSGFQQRNIFGAALGVAAAHIQRRVKLVHDGGESFAVDRKSAPRRGGRQGHDLPGGRGLLCDEKPRGGDEQGNSSKNS